MVRLRADKVAIIADGGLNIRECANKHGVSYSYVAKLRKKFASGALCLDVSKEVDIGEVTKKRVESFLEIAEQVLVSVSRMVKTAAESPDTLKNPELFRNVVGGAKIISDAVNGRRYFDVGRNTPSDAAGSDGQEDAQSDSRANVTPIRAAG